MQLEDIESFISKMYLLNLTQLVRLSELRGKEGGLSYSNVSEYNVRIRDDDRYRKIKIEIEVIKEDGNGAVEAKHNLYHLLADRVDELSDESVERIRRRGAGNMVEGRMSGPDAFAKANRTWNDRVTNIVEKEKDRDFLESCQIKGDTSWIR